LLSFQRHAEDIAGRHGLTPQRYLLLLLIRVGTDVDEPVTVTRLCEPLQMTQSAVTQLVTGAERAGLIKRVSDPDDGRSQHLRLTALGSRKLRRTFDALGEERSRILEALGRLTRAAKH
jgi:DNA-binding MarR family transcriptional regulator